PRPGRAPGGGAAGRPGPGGSPGGRPRSPHPAPGQPGAGGAGRHRRRLPAAPGGPGGAGGGRPHPAARRLRPGDRHQLGRGPGRRRRRPGGPGAPGAGAVKRLGLARAQDDALSLAVRQAGWEPVPLFLTAMAGTQAPPPAESFDAVIVLSPTAARLGLIPPGAPCLAQGEATARALGGRPVRVSAEARAEGLYELLRAAYPAGGTFLLARGERSREFLEEAA